MGADAEPSSPVQSQSAGPIPAGSAPIHQPPKPPDTETESPFRKAFGKFVELLALGLLFLVIGVVAWLVIFLFGKLRPARMVTVRQFEISSDIANRMSVSGKTASDIVVDTLNDTASNARAYHGTDYYDWGSTGSQPLALQQSITIPLQASYQIEISGISLDSLMRLYDSARYDQWTIGGDIISSPKGLVGRVRLNRGDQAQSWETPPSASATPAELIREATYMMLASVSPDLLGQSYLQQNNLDAAAKVFRQWAKTEPQDWRPSYYLSLVYDNQRDEQNAKYLADWARKIEALNHRKPAQTASASVDSQSTSASELANDTQLVLKAGDALDLSHASVSEKKQALHKLQEVEREAEDFSKSDPGEVTYLIQSARILDREALLESSLDPSSEEAVHKSEEAFKKLNQAIKQVPGNAGLYEQRAVLSVDRVTIMKNRNKSLAEIQAKQEEEVKDYLTALEMRPNQPGPLWGAVYSSLDLHRAQDAVALAKTIALLQPDSNVAAVAYNIAFEGSKKERPVTETDQELETRLKTVLQTKPDEGQMLALFFAFQNSNNQKAMDMVVADGKVRFPKDATFQTQAVNVAQPHP
jgi:tetratricopeptide (TPR) repeat protein